MTKTFRHNLILFFLIFSSIPSCILFAQEKPDSSFLNASAVQFVQPLYAYSLIETRKNALAEDSIPELVFTKKLPEKYSVNIPNSLVGKSIYLKFFLKNIYDTALSVYYFGGT